MRAALDTEVRRDDRIAVIYDRASTAMQKDNYSRADAARLSEFAERIGYKWELRKEIKSGENLVNRPIMRQLLGDIADGKVGAIICQDFTRLSRDEDGIDGRIIRQACRDNGCLIITPDKTYDFTLDVDDDLADIGFLIGKIQKRQNLKSLTKGMMEKARQGKLMPTYARLGYDWSELNKETGKKAPTAELKVNQREAEIVRLIFDLYEQKSQKQVALYLNESGHRMPCKSPGWRRKYGREQRLFVPKDINDIISDPLYTGLVIWGRNCRSRYTKGFEAQSHFFPELQLISFEQFNRCQRIKEQRYRLPGKSVFSPYMYSGMLRCVYCGGPTVGKRHRERRGGEYSMQKKYECRGYHTAGSTACRGQSIYETVVRRAVMPFLLDVLLDKINLRHYLEAAARQYDTEKADKEEYLRAEIANTELGMKRLVDAIADGAIITEQAKTKNMELLEQKERAQRRLEAIQHRQEMREEIVEALKLLNKDLEGVLNAMPDEVHSQLVRMVFRSFSVEASGFGWERQAEIKAYEFQPEFADLLAHSLHTARHGR